MRGYFLPVSLSLISLPKLLTSSFDSSAWDSWGAPSILEVLGVLLMEREAVSCSGDAERSW